MKRIAVFSMLTVLAACGSGEAAPGPGAEAEGSTPAAATPAPTASAPQMGELTVPEWYAVDESARTVTMTVTAGQTDAKNYWNFNGAHDGNMTISVPEGYTVTIEFVNDDPNMAHSLGISAQTSGFGATPDVTPAFEGAITQNPTSMMEATMPGESETITFEASTAGEYAMVCYVPGHAATGMYVLFDVTSDGTAGVQTAM